MAKRVISAADVTEARASGTLVVPPDAIITPLARDRARDMGVTITQGAAGAPAPRGEGDELTAKVRAIVTSLLGDGGGGSPAPTSSRARRPVKLARAAGAKPERFTYPGPPPDMQVKTVDVVTTQDGSPVAAGYMTMTAGSFPWTLTYDEVQIVLEGELHLGGDAGGKVARPGDVLFVPNGSSITFGTPEWVKFVYVTFPANWEEQIR